MLAYKEALSELNTAQRQAVEAIDGPVLVLAGPGTGKTQLLGVRAAHILAQTDTLPQQILCLTFTENGAENMRERLTRFIGKGAYDVHISTYHAFGSEIIRRFPEAFAELRLQTPIDDLSKHQVVSSIVEALRYDNPLKQTRHHLGDLIGTISEVKRALLTPASLRAIAAENQAFIAAANKNVQAVFADIGTLPRTATKASPLFEKLLAALKKHIPAEPAHPRFGSLGAIAQAELAQAITDAQSANSTKPLTAWKNNWLAKNADNQFVFDGLLKNQRIESLAAVLESYDQALQKEGWYDFDDMIMLAGRALEENPDLKFTLQEQYLYIMLDEFQDTNAAQLRLVQLLSDNPVSEGHPNVLAVGDDDQAIYAFQGAQYSNMLDFYRMYRDVKVISLTDNYRSTPEILYAAHNIAGQIQARLASEFGITKHLSASGHGFAETPFPIVDPEGESFETRPERRGSKVAPPRVNGLREAVAGGASIARREFLSDVAQYDWMAKHIAELIQQGVRPREIAVLAPKHRQLEPLVPYLGKHGVPVRYEKRENILEAKVIKQLLAMSRLVFALKARDKNAANALWPEVLSFDFWRIPVRDIWQLAWSLAGQAKTGEDNWTTALLGHNNPALGHPGLLLSALAGRVETEPFEQILDLLIGNAAVTVSDGDNIRSPLRAYYLSPEAQAKNPSLFYDTISHLTVLRARLREYQAAKSETLTLAALVEFANLYAQSGQQIPSTSPYSQQADAVQLMTVFKAKGLEFGHVFLPSTQDEVWGALARGYANKLSLPANLAPIRHAGATDDERLRLLFVAITRAKRGLHLASFARTFAGKDTKRLKYLDEQEQNDGTFKSLVLPDSAQTVILSDHQAPALESLELSWQNRHSESRGQASLHELLRDRLNRYQLSPTDLTRFIDLQYGGPESLFFKTILRFPEAPTANSQFGDAIHRTLEWLQHETDKTGQPPGTKAVQAYFSAVLKKGQFTPEQFALEEQRGHRALAAYLAARGHIFKPHDRAEYGFRNEGVLAGSAHLTGKIDRMEVNRAAKTITVVDYKTGASHSRWSSDARLHKYQRQLYCYKLLIEGSHSFAGYRVPKGRIEFIEPDHTQKVHYLELDFADKELEQTKQLVQAVWQRIQALDFPDVSGYEPTLTGIRQFEADLLTL
ncbi:MAG: ATP-dependent helicase [Candidatus Saccharimonadales bacterium]